MGSQSSVCQLQGPLGSGSLSPPPEPVLSGPAGLLLLHLHPPPAPCLTLQAQCPEQSFSGTLGPSCVHAVARPGDERGER